MSQEKIKQLKEDYKKEVKEYIKFMNQFDKKDDIYHNISGIIETYRHVIEDIEALLK